MFWAQIVQYCQCCILTWPTLQKKWSLPLRISSVNVTKSVVLRIWSQKIFFVCSAILYTSRPIRLRLTYIFSLLWLRIIMNSYLEILYQIWGSFLQYLHKVFQKNIISCPLIRTHKCISGDFCTLLLIFLLAR